MVTAAIESVRRCAIYLQNISNTRKRSEKESFINFLWLTLAIAEFICDMTAELGVYFVTNSFGDTLPLIIKPNNVDSSSVNYLKQWITENQETLDRQLLEYGILDERNY